MGEGMLCCRGIRRYNEGRRGIMAEVEHISATVRRNPSILFQLLHWHNGQGLEFGGITEDKYATRSIRHGLPHV